MSRASLLLFQLSQYYFSSLCCKKGNSTRCTHVYMWSLQVFYE